MEGEPDFAPSSRLREATSGRPLWVAHEDLLYFRVARARPEHVRAGGSRELPQYSVTPRGRIRGRGRRRGRERSAW
jgi:hypothetical protein